MMTTAHLTRHQARKPSCDIVGFLLTYRIEWTDAHPAFGFVGAAVTCAVFAVIKWRWL